MEMLAMELYSHACFDEEVFYLTPLSVNFVYIVILHVNKHQDLLIKKKIEVLTV